MGIALIVFVLLLTGVALGIYFSYIMDKKGYDMRAKIGMVSFLGGFAAAVLGVIYCFQKMVFHMVGATTQDFFLYTLMSILFSGAAIFSLFTAPKTILLHSNLRRYGCAVPRGK